MNRQSSSSGKLALALAIAIPVTIVALVAANRYLSRSSSESGKNNSNTQNASAAVVKSSSAVEGPKVTILYATCTGTSRNFANTLGARVRTLNNAVVDVVDLSEFDEFLLEKGGIFFFLISTFSEGQCPESSRRFMSWIQEFVHDFRVDKNYLQKVKFGVFGLGGKVYKKNFCTAARDLNNALVDLGATPLVPSLFGDDASNLEEKFQTWSDLVHKSLQTISEEVVVETSNTNNAAAEGGIRPKKFFKDQRNNKQLAKKAVEEQQARANASVAAAAATSNVTKTDECCGGNGASDGGCCKSSESATMKTTHSQSAGGCCSSGGNGDAQGADAEPLDYNSSDEEEEDRINSEFVTMDIQSDDENDEDNDEDNNHTNAASNVGSCGDGEAEGDLEDIGRTLQSASVGNKGSSASNGATTTTGSEREMVTKLQRKALVKEGYRIIGSHSAVKLCRWTKNQMRGRGGCYKHSFYGITSYQCMEATPSLACANKCVFCWRHHKNPVGTEWRWKTDSPSMIVEDAVNLHKTMINEMRGVPGVLPERLAEANTVKHCALSLVGEPIMYPHINDMLHELHDRKISSFLVTNAQFPDRIQQLDPVTQLYVSVDAATKDSLKAIDRPLFKNYWDRFLGALAAIRDKRQRTVYRLTLVKDWNMEETEAYAELIELGQPDFIEIKAVTYCGKSDASSLTMQNVPWHKEVCEYSEAIAERLRARGKGPVYSIATEHEHSCCILLAREDKFLVNGVWHTWINYDKFQELMVRYYASNGAVSFCSEDYMEPTPSWAYYKSEARGFDPIENKWKRNKAGAVVPIDYKASSSGCG
jgi:wyosine [tRNA(Phe)-imidazoG37] synthetase (radical SAM superfamily)/flavodoxin